MNDCKIVIWFAFALIIVNGCSTNTPEFGKRPDSSGDTVYQGPWACSQNFQIAINQQNSPQQNLTSGYKDFKPSWSKSSGKLTFFRRISNPKVITEMNLENVYEYPRWSEDGQYLVYDSNTSGPFQVYAYHLESKATTNISPDKDRNYRFAHCKNMPK